MQSKHVEVCLRSTSTTKKYISNFLWNICPFFPLCIGIGRCVFFFKKLVGQGKVLCVCVVVVVVVVGGLFKIILQNPPGICDRFRKILSLLSVLFASVYFIIYMTRLPPSGRFGQSLGEVIHLLSAKCFYWQGEKVVRLLLAEWKMW